MWMSFYWSITRRFLQFATGRMFHKRRPKNRMVIDLPTSKNSRRHSATDDCIPCDLQKATSNHGPWASTKRTCKFHLRIQNLREYESLNIRESHNFRRVMNKDIPFPVFRFVPSDYRYKIYGEGILAFFMIWLSFPYVYQNKMNL